MSRESHAWKELWQLTEKDSEQNIILEQVYSNRDCASYTSTNLHKGWDYELIFKPLEHWKPTVCLRVRILIYSNSKYVENLN